MSMRFALYQLTPAMLEQAKAKLGMQSAEAGPRQPNKWETEWLLQLRAAGLPDPQTEYRFTTARKWRFDAAWPSEKIAFECDGGVWMKGGGAHSRPQNIERDIEKINHALLEGWRVFRVTPKMIKDGSAIALAKQVLGGLRCSP